MRILKILKWLAKFGGHILLYHLIIRFVFKYKILFYKVKKGYYLSHVYIKEGYKVDHIQYTEEELKSRMKALKEEEEKFEIFMKECEDREKVRKESRMKVLKTLSLIP